jgi:hypothetical protein
MGIFKKRDKEENREAYYIDYYDEHGRRQRESTGSSHRAFAKELLTKRKDEVNQRKKFPERYLGSPTSLTTITSPCTPKG